jgi:hypothetical protein
MRRITWNEALACPAIAGLAEDARSIAQNARRDWFPGWLPTSRCFMDGLRALASWLDVGNLDDIRDTVLTGLLDEYHTERRNVRHAWHEPVPTPIEDPPEPRPERLAEHGWRADRRWKRQL